MTLPVLGSSLPRFCSPKFEYQTMPSIIDDHVMRLDRLARQIVFGIDDARRRAGRARQGLQFEIPFRPGAEVDAGEIFGRAPVDPHPLIAPLFHQALGAPQLRMRRNALVHIALHARQDHGQEFVGAVLRIQRPRQRVTADAIEQLPLLGVGARHAGEPFCISKLRGNILDLAQRKVGRRGLVGYHRNLTGAIEVVASGPDTQGILARLEPAGRETVTAVLAGHDGDGDGRSVSFGADQNAFQRLLPVGDLARQRRAGLRHQLAGAAQPYGGYQATDAHHPRNARHDHLP